MTKKEFVELYFEKGGFETKVEAEKKAKVFLETVEEALAKGEEVSFVGWGKWEVVEKAERVGRNPKTGEEITIPAKKAIKFKVGKALEEKVNK